MSTVLPEPNFIDRDPQAITSAMIAAYEDATGRTLQPAQVERLLIDVIAYRETLTRIQIQEAAKQNLLAYASFPMLDYLGQLLNVTRLEAQPAETTILFTLSGVQVFDVIIPAGTRIRTQDGKLNFATLTSAIIGSGVSYVSVVAQAMVAGVAGNAYGTGDIATLIDSIAGVGTAVNIDAASGGIDAENDDRYRERIREAPEKFSVAGSAGAYRYWAMTAHQSIIDVGVTAFEFEAGLVRLYVLTRDGLPSEEILGLVSDITSGEKVRPISDSVWVGAPTEASYTISAELTVLRSADSVAVMSAAQASAEAFAADRRAGLGRDVVPSAVIAALSVPGVYHVNLIAPAMRILNEYEWANCTTITLTLAGVADG